MSAEPLKHRSNSQIVKALNSPVLSNEPHVMEINDGMTRLVSDFDYVRYEKHDAVFEKVRMEMSKKIMKRCFDAFDVELHGALKGDRFDGFAEYIRNPTLEKQFPNKSVTWDEFWAWWENLEDNDDKEEFFSLVGGQFSVPFHVHQLIIEESGEKFTLNYRVNFKLRDTETEEVRPCSPWHDIPLFVRTLVKTTPSTAANLPVNFICEIPKYTRAKFEISRTEPFNPIKQDTKNGVPRFYRHGDVFFNYGAFPQSWESTQIPFKLPDGSEVKGDNDPIDGLEIGVQQLKTGSVTPVKILGILGMIDDGEMDWKLICVAIDDPLARSLNDINDVEIHMPGILDCIREWLRVYKICQGGEENKFAFNGEYQPAAYAHKVLQESHLMWANLRKIKGAVNV